MKNKLFYIFSSIILVFIFTLTFGLKTYTYELDISPKLEQNVIDKDIMDIEFSDGGSGTNKVFEVKNMVPGDVEEKQFCVRVFYKDKVAVKYNAVILPEYKKLAEVLKTKVIVNKTGKVLYEGLIEGMPDSINYNLRSATKTDKVVCYTIIVYLDKDVGNEYQNLPLAVNLEWWVEESHEPDEPDEADNPNTGDTIIKWVIISLVLVMCLAITIYLSRKGGKKE